MIQTRAMVYDDKDKKRRMVNNCPKCGAIIWKDGGCRKMVCFQYNCRFCFTCTSTKECKCIGASGHDYLNNRTDKVYYVDCWIQQFLLIQSEF